MAKGAANETVVSVLVATACAQSPQGWLFTFHLDSRSYCPRPSRKSHLAHIS
jgi:hypothetical protein